MNLPGSFQLPGMFHPHASYRALERGRAGMLSRKWAMAFRLHPSIWVSRARAFITSSQGRGPKESRLLMRAISLTNVIERQLDVKRRPHTACALN